jgi:hypothetical protein
MPGLTTRSARARRFEVHAIPLALLPPTQCIPSTSHHPAEGTETSNAACFQRSKCICSVDILHRRRPRFVRVARIEEKGAIDRMQHQEHPARGTSSRPNPLSAARQCRGMNVGAPHTQHSTSIKRYSATLVSFFTYYREATEIVRLSSRFFL